MEQGVECGRVRIERRFEIFDPYRRMNCLRDLRPRGDTLRLSRDPRFTIPGHCAPNQSKVELIAHLRGQGAAVLMSAVSCVKVAVVPCGLHCGIETRYCSPRLSFAAWGYLFFRNLEIGEVPGPCLSWLGFEMRQQWPRYCCVSTARRLTRASL